MLKTLNATRLVLARYGNSALFRWFTAVAWLVAAGLVPHFLALAGPRPVPGVPRLVLLVDRDRDGAGQVRGQALLVRTLLPPSTVLLRGRTWWPSG